MPMEMLLLPLAHVHAAVRNEMLPPAELNVFGVVGRPEMYSLPIIAKRELALASAVELVATTPATWLVP